MADFDVRPFSLAETGPQGLEQSLFGSKDTGQRFSPPGTIVPLTISQFLFRKKAAQRTAVTGGHVRYTADLYDIGSAVHRISPPFWA